MRFSEKYKQLGENSKIVLNNVIGAFLVKGIALFVTLFTLPAYIKFFNNDELLGLWFTFLSILNWILNFDLGIGNGLRNHLSTSIAVGDKEESKRLISSAYFSIGIIVCLASVLFPIFIRKVDLNTVFNIAPSILTEKSIYLSVVILLIGVMLQFWLRLINSILYALQKSSLNNFMVLCTNLLILLYVKYAPSGNNNENIVIMAIVHGMAVLIPVLIATFWVFGGALRFAIPNIKYITRDCVQKVISLGGVFFFIQIAYMIIMSTNEYLITLTTSNSNNIDYQVYYKFFSIGSTIFALMLTPIWSVVTKAKAENNIKWIKVTYRRLVFLGVFFSTFQFLLIFIARPLIKLWLGNQCIDNISIPICILFAVLGMFMIFSSVFSSIANGIGQLKGQSISYGIGCILKVPLAFFLVSLLNNWIGVLLSNIICLAIYCFCEPFLLNHYFKKNIIS